MSMRSLTRKESVALRLIQERITNQQPCPSLTEIAEAVGARYRSTGHKVVEGLIEKGFVIRRSHGLKLIELADAVPPVAIVEKEVVRHVHKEVPVPMPPVSPHAPKDQARMASTRRKRTYVVELERDVNRRLRLISDNAGIPAEAIISQALRAWIMDVEESESH
jgi:SOS-response transcriptional repressor LexA